MKARRSLVSVVDFVVGIFRVGCGKLIADNANIQRPFGAGKFSLVNRAAALLLITAMLSPAVFFGRAPRVSAGSFAVAPAIELPPVLAAGPEPFVAKSVSFSSRSFSPLAILSIWDEVASWLTGPETEPSDSAPNTDPAEIAPLLPPPSTGDLSRARLSPKNQTGGMSLYSRNFAWGTGLAGLSGRGLDAGFGISYNSLVWTKVGSEMIFNPNNDNVTPGFRFGFPVIEPSYTDPLTGKTTHLMVTPSGGRVEFRLLTGSSDTFETADSSYAQLKVIDSNTLVVATTDGTQSVYTLKNGAFRCASVKDRNGNYVTVGHDTNGLLQSVTDTLGRVINVSYDSGGQPTSVTQTWASGTHTFATFTYTTATVNTNFSGLSLVGITNNTSVKVLQKITFADSSYVTFDYNNYGQVWKVSNYAADNHLLNYASVNLDNSTLSSAQSDVPRFSEMRNWTENFNLNASNVAQEVVVPVSYQENQSFTLPDNSTASGTLLQVTAPDGVVSKTFVGGSSSGWMEAVPILTEDWVYENSTWVRKRWNYSAYTQDNTSLGYILNPRVTETKVGDSTNIKRTTIDYHLQSGSSTVALYGLVKDVVQYDANGTSQLKKSHTEYNLSSAYTNLRVIGLPSESTLYDHNNALMAKVTYQYDEGNFSGTGQSMSATQHDATNYGTGFVTGRGNLTSTTRWDATAPTNSSLAITRSVKYNITGNPISNTDPLNRTVSISYADNFDDNTNRNTFAYPTQITDPASNSSTVKYRFETGANVYAVSPAPANNSAGKTTARTYDSIGRLQQETVVNTGAYTRYEYPTNGIQSKVYATITDVNNNGADSYDEVLSESWFDGAGRVRMSRSEHPGSTGGWSATIAEYDVMGRVKRSSVPTEVNSSWQAAGDDATRGFVWNAQEYDWKGRVTRQINTDGTDKLISYDGCGCAGGQVTTVQSELVPREDNPSVTARRTQKIYEDILGRTYKAETLNWNGTVYSTDKSFFNGRDQVTTARQYSGSDTISTYQDTVMTYDGHGRLYSQHRPEQNTGTATVYSYYADDRVQQVTDARGATVSYTYNSRGLITEISTTSPNTSTIPVTPTVTFSYDNIGNRTAMTDGLGNVAYEYDQLSQLTAETRQFNDNLPNAPLSNNRFKVQYSYSYSGQLKSIIDPYGQQFNYSFDKTGRLNSVTGSTFANITTYANNPNYRAWGALKSLSYGSGAQMAVSHNNRLQAESYTLTSNSTQLLQNTYQYYADGKFKYLHDTRPGYVNGIFDRSNLYDHDGRIIQGKSGGEARGETVTNLPVYLPYRQVYQYNAFDNLTQRNNLHWGTDTWQGIPNNHSYNYQNNRITNSGYQYDADGRMLFSTTIGDSAAYQYNAAGNVVFFQDYSSLPVNAHFRTYDGNEREIKRITNTNFPPTEENPTEQNIWNTAYYIRSTVLGNETLTEVDSTGKKLKTFVNASGVNLATQYIIRESGTAVETVSFNHWDESGMNFITTGYSSGDDIGILDPLGGNMGTETRYIENNNPQPVNKDIQPQELMPNDQMYVDGQKVSCLQDGLRIGCSSLFGTTANSLFAELNGHKLPVEKINNAIWTPTDYLRDARYRETGVPRTSQWGVLDVRDLSKTGQEKDDLDKKTLIKNAKEFLNNKQYPCKDTFNKILAQLSKDTGIELDEGGIDYYLDELEKTGEIMVKPGESVYGGGTALAPDYGTPGWGIEFAVRSGEGKSIFIQNMNTLVGETVHAIGHRKKESRFTDLAVHQALVNMGVAYSMEETIKMPWFQNTANGYKRDGDIIPEWVASSVWHSYTMWKCGHPNYNPPNASPSYKPPGIR